MSKKFRVKDNLITYQYQPVCFTSLPFSDVDEDRRPGESWLNMRLRTDPERTYNKGRHIALNGLIAEALNSIDPEKISAVMKRWDDE